MFSGTTTIHTIFRKVYSDTQLFLNENHLTPRFSVYSGSRTPLQMSGDVVCKGDCHPSLTDIACDVIDLDVIFSSILQLVVSSPTSQELEYAVRVFIFMLVSFSSTSLMNSNELFLRILLTTLKNKIEPNKFHLTNFAALLSLLAACPSKIVKSSNMKVLWYGSSGEEDMIVKSIY